jgi:DNA-directed RNA polymerase specialized sigma24 family protein
VARILDKFNGLLKTATSPSEFERFDLRLLVKRAQRGDFTSFLQLALVFDSSVLQTALRITGSARPAAELYRRTFLRAYRNLAQFHFECSFSVWIFRQLAQLCMEHLRKQSSRLNSADEQWFAEALIQLTPRERMIAELKFGHGFSLSLVSEILEVPREETRLSLLRAIDKLRTSRCAERSSTAARHFAEEVACFSKAPLRLRIEPE